MQKHHGIIVKGVNEDAKNEEVFGGIDGWGAVCRGAAGDAGEPAADFPIFYEIISMLNL